MNSLRYLLEGSIDYAGLFPPAGLGMEEAVRNFASYRRGDHSWMLGRFIVPVFRLEECSSAADALPEDLRDGVPWKLSALAGEDLAADVDAIKVFNKVRRLAHLQALVVDTIEFRADDLARLEQARQCIPRDLQVYAEIPVDTDPAPLLSALAESGMRAKVRTGGVTREAFPSSEDLARFISLCVRSGLMFKATAGLHHSLRGRYPLTYDTGSPTAMMHGFLNVFLAAGAASAGGSEGEIRQILEETDPGALRIDAEGISWRHRRLSVHDIAASRARFASAFGSCSFLEPVDELLDKGLP